MTGGCSLFLEELSFIKYGEIYSGIQWKPEIASAFEENQIKELVVIEEIEDTEKNKWGCYDMQILYLALVTKSV